MSNLLDKMRAAKTGTAAVTGAITQRADQLLARQANVSKDIDTAFRPHEGLLDEAEQGLAEIESAARLLTNE